MACRTAGLISAALLIAVGCARGGPPYFIPGSATLPACAEAPAFDVNGSRWGDSGTVTVTSAGCDGAQAGQTFASCSLTWEMSQVGSEVEILVDEEYRILGRICGDTLHLEGGWWLPVFDSDENQCTYDEDSAEEVGIEQEGSALTAVDARTLRGTLVLRGACSGTYEMELIRFP